ncbi:response regulator [Anaeromyxobacter paludicola]|uniref:Response regulator n=1 Tax=Anaeromyxobacter paludicola TaxID=2918171 RepID=A0ABM7XDK1_9BACT|nr:response regulator [Anaeromyxobacter paludicola]BDG09955.1 response regulator [Anaeromyxobacter paludicola]
MHASTPRHDPLPVTRPASYDVLVVDDDADIRETVEEILSCEGFEVATARNGAEALERLRAGVPRLILLDLFMPVMDGVEFRRNQLADPALAGVPTVVISAADALELRVSTLHLTGALEKPLHLDVLMQTVERFCC